MGVYESSSKIKRVIKDMNIVWSQTKEVWKDEKSVEFDAFVKRLATEIEKVEKSLDNIYPLLNRIQTELRE